jgi:hypothetical protein
VILKITIDELLNLTCLPFKTDTTTTTKTTILKTLTKTTTWK